PAISTGRPAPPHGAGASAPPWPAAARCRAWWTCRSPSTASAERGRRTRGVDPSRGRLPALHPQTKEPLMADPNPSRPPPPTPERKRASPLLWILLLLALLAFGWFIYSQRAGVTTAPEPLPPSPVD